MARTACGTPWQAICWPPGRHWRRPDHCITPAYASQEVRDAAIDTGAGLPVAELLTDVSKSAAAFRTETSTLPEDAWHFAVRVLDHPKFPAEQLLVRRLVEIELHHTDLNVGYQPADWPSTFATIASQQT